MKIAKYCLCVLLVSFLFALPLLARKRKHKKHGHGHVARSKSNLKIIGGSNATNKRQFPYIVAIGAPGGSPNALHHLCDGSIVAPNWVMSAARCFQRWSTQRNVKVWAGQLYLGDPTVIQSIRVDKIFNHPRYNSARPNENDIALLRLKSNFTFRDEVRSIGLPFSGQEFSGLTVQAGFGQTKVHEGQRPLRPLKYFYADILSTEDCRNSVDNMFITKNMICTYSRMGVAFKEDYGGALLQDRILIGINTFHKCETPRCTTGYSIYTKVSAYYDFFKSVSNSFA